MTLLHQPLMPANKQGKHWCFTTNNYTEDDEIQLLRDAAQDQGVLYVVVGRETGESGTPHLQGYVQFSKRVYFGRLKTFCPQGSHIESAKGTPKQASEYCKKDGDYKEVGTLQAGQGARNDLLAVYEACKRGVSFGDIAESHPSAAIRYGAGIQRVRQLYQPPRTAPPQIWCFWGKTGTGKTRRVWEYSNADAIWVHPGAKWFDGYDGQPAVLFDDFDGSWFKLSYFLRLLDRYIMPVPVKGGHTWWVPKTVFITSNLKPEEWYPNAHENHKSALMRRLSEFGTIVECTQYTPI